MHLLLLQSRRIFSFSKTMHFLLFLSMLECAAVPRLNNNDAPSLHEQPCTTTVNAVINQEPAPVPIEEKNEDVFIHKIKEAELLYNPIILEAASQNGVDLTIIKAIIMTESGFNSMSLSEEGAVGLMQLMPETAKSLGVKDLYNPEENIQAGVRYFKGLLNRFNGDTKMALAAYNAGASKVINYNGVPPFRETRLYIRKVLSYQSFYKHGNLHEETNL